MKDSLFMIQGVFFFAYPEQDLQYYHFAGMIHPDSTGDSLEGTLNDHFGDSNLTGVKLDDGTLEFTKTYKGREDPIRVSLKKPEGSEIWLGGYQGTMTGSGRMKCLVTEVPLSFLSPAFL